MKKEWRKEDKVLYLPKQKPTLVDIPTMNFFVVDGKGNPNTLPDFQETMNLLYSLSYAVKMSPKAGYMIDNYSEYTIYPLEGVWDLDEEGRKLDVLDKDHFVYSIMIRQPDFVTKKVATEIIERAKKKKPELNYNKVRYESITEGLCVQILHIGSYDSEKESFNKMDAFCKENNLERLSLVHKEIYLSDARKVEPSKLKTVLRYKVRKLNK